MASFNEFQRELQRAGIEPRTARLFTMIYERLIHVAKETEETSKVVLALAETVGNVVDLHKVTQDRVKQLAKHNETEGIDVRSEPIDRKDN